MQVISAGAFIAALITEIKFKDLDSVEKLVIRRATDILGQNELFLKTEAVAGLVMATSGISILVGVIALVGRMCNTRLSSSDYKIFSCLVRLISCGLEPHMPAELIGQSDL